VADSAAVQDHPVVGVHVHGGGHTVDLAVGAHISNHVLNGGEVTDIFVNLEGIGWKVIQEEQFPHI